MLGKARGGGARAVGLQPVAGQCDEARQARTVRALPQRPRELVAIQSRQPDIQERDLGLEARGFGERLRAVVGDAHRVPEYSHQLRDRLRGIDVVVDDEHAAGGPARPAAGAALPPLGRAARAPRRAARR